MTSSREPAIGVRLWPQAYAIARLRAVPRLPALAPGDPPAALIVGHDEVTVVGPEKLVASVAGEGDQVAAGWRALTLDAVFPLATVGVLATVSRALADVGVPVMVLSSHDTDHFLVPEGSLGRALAALNQAVLGRFLPSPTG